MYGDREAEVLRLQDYPNGVAAGLRTKLYAGRHEIVTAGADPDFALIGSDPWNTVVNTGLDVPAAPTRSLDAGLRYLFLLARAQFNSGDKGVRLTGMRQYAELVARVPQEGAPTAVFRKEIRNPIFHPPDGSITWHVMVIPKTSLARRNPANADSLIFRDSYGPALLYETAPTPPTAYIPPNGGRPWGKPIGSSLGNIHDLRYRWRHEDFEYALDLPLPLPCDVALFASVRQNDPETNPSDVFLTANQFAALSEEEKFLTSFRAFAQYGRIAGSLIFNQNLGRDVP